MSENEQGPQQGEPIKPSKQELKRQQIFLDRMRGHMRKGMTEQQAFDTIQRENYERLPDREKIKRLEALIVRNAQALSTDLQGIHKNQAALADIMDVNFLAFEKMLAKLGLSPEDQKKIFDEAEDEFIAKRRAEQAAQKAAAHAELEKKNEDKVQEVVDEPGQPPEPPEGSVVYGG